MTSLVPFLTHALPLLVALGISLMLTAHLASARTRLLMLDLPNERSLHHFPVSRTGGLAILAGLTTSLAIIAGLGFFDFGLAWPLSGAALVALISFMDDRSGVGVVPRFAVHALAAILALFGGVGLHALSLGGWSWAWPLPATLCFSFLFLVWMTNLYNFMDGMDGFAGGMGLAGFGFLGLFGWLSGDAGYALICWSTSLACMGFLFFNFPPARIFMGDTGASFLGFFAGVMVLWADRQALFPFWAGLLAFSPFIVDATVTLLRRLLAGERVWQAHRSHYYQRLVQLGWGHRKTVLAEYVVMIAAGKSALLMLLAESTVVILAGMILWSVLYAALALGVRRLERRKRRSSAGVEPDMRLKME